MPEKRKLIIVNQAVNYLTIGLANAFYRKMDEVVLMTGSIHVQGEELNPNIKVQKINKWYESPASKKAFSYLIALCTMWWLLLIKYRKYEVLFVSVPPMGYLLNLFLPHKFSMIIWDIYPDIFKITGMKESSPGYIIWSWLNKRSFKKSYRLFTISERMADLLEKYVARDKIIVQPIWAIFQSASSIEKQDNLFIKNHNLENKFIIQYSGNIGLTHNVEAMIDLAEVMKDEKEVLFQIIGRGPRKKYLEELVNKRNLPNCMFLPFQSDEMFPHSLSAADVGVVILDEKTSKGSVPSKSYNLMGYGIPSLYIASTDSQLQIYAEKYKHAICCDKQQIEVAKKYILSLKNDPTLYMNTRNNALNASNDFKRGNADKFVEFYLMNREYEQ